MANYAEMTAYELEQKYDSLANEMMVCNDDARIESIVRELDEIRDELDGRETFDWED